MTNRSLGHLEQGRIWTGWSGMRFFRLIPPWRIGLIRDEIKARLRAYRYAISGVFGCISCHFYEAKREFFDLTHAG